MDAVQIWNKLYTVGPYLVLLWLPHKAFFSAQLIKEKFIHPAHHVVMSTKSNTMSSLQPISYLGGLTKHDKLTTHSQNEAYT